MFCQNPKLGGGGEIRTRDGLSPIPVFKTGALNHYATPPFLDYIINKGYMIELMIWLMK